MGFGPDDKDDELPIALSDEEDLEERLSKLPLHRQKVWLDTCEQALEETGNREQAEKLAWAAALVPDEENEEEEPRIHHHSGEAPG